MRQRGRCLHAHTHTRAHTHTCLCVCELTPFPLPQCFPFFCSTFQNSFPAPCPHLTPLAWFLSFPTSLPRCCPSTLQPPPVSFSVPCLESSYHCCRAHLRIAASKDGTPALSLRGLFLSLEPPLPLCQASHLNQGCLYSSVKPAE